MCGFTAQLVEHRTGNVKVTGLIPVGALIFVRFSSFQLVKLENLLQWSTFTFIYNHSTKYEFHIYFTWLPQLILHSCTLLLCRTDVDALLDDIVAKESLITPSKMEQVRKLIISILKERIVQLL